jgi:hypothetical protein
MEGGWVSVPDYFTKLYSINKINWRREFHNSSKRENIKHRILGLEKKRSNVTLPYIF